MTYKYCFFDADDTLFDFYKSAQVSFTKSLEDFGIILDDPKIFESFAAISRKLWHLFEKGEIPKSVIRADRFRLTFEKHRIDLDPQQMSVVYLEKLCENVFLMPSAVEVCQEIKNRGMTLGIITNGIRSVQFARFQRTPLQELIDFAIFSEENLKPKPHGQMFEAALSKANNPNKKDCIMIGDNLTSDILGANRAGIDSCWFNPRREENTNNILPKFEIKDLKEVLTL